MTDTARFEVCHIEEGWVWKIKNFNELVSFFTEIIPEEYIDYYIKDNEFGDTFTPIDIMNEL